MKRLKAAAALAVLLGFIGLWTAFAQSSTDLTLVDKVAWWTRRPAAQPTGNPTNFEVAAGLQGDESVAALRVLIRGDVTKATLVLGEADAPFKDVTPGKLRVCTTNVPWLVVDGGAFADAPAADCSNAVELTRVKDPAGNGSWSGDVTSMLSGARSEVTLMVVPSPDKGAVLPAPYWIKFLARVDAEGTPDAQPSSTPTPPTSPAVSATPAPPRATTPTGSLTPATTAPPTTVAVATEAAQPRRFAVASAAKSKKPWGKLALLIPLAALFAALYTGGRKYWAQRLETAAAA
ncbi:MAG: hypothetical protein QOI95_2773 [Acidimicrobiaceae bacterium]|jgi:hypothetical protein